MKREVNIGNVSLGGNNPVRIKGMLKSSTGDAARLAKEAKSLEKEGAEVIRFAVKNQGDAKLVSILKKRVSVPLVADVHFNYRLALLSIAAGFDGIRLNPLNIYKPQEVKEVVKEAKKSKVSIRVGINSGGFKEDFLNPQQLASKMVGVVSKYLKLIERANFFDTIVSLKTPNIESTILANKEFAKRFDYPLHLGVTAAGPFLEGVIKSSLGVGILLSEGIGEAIRISLTAPSFWEIRVAKFILQFLGLRHFFSEIISCPTCSRCEVNLIKMAEKFRRITNKLKKENLPKKVAIMGCVVNGPGEAYQADIGLAFGKKKAAIFKKREILGWTKEDRALVDLLTKWEGEYGNKRN